MVFRKPGRKTKSLDVNAGSAKESEIFKLKRESVCKNVFFFFSQSSINGVGLTKPLTTSLNPTSKHSSHLRKPSNVRVVGRCEVGITGYQPNIDAW